MKPGCSEQRIERGVESKNDEDRLGFSLCRQFVRFFQSFTSYLFFFFLPW